ncbi:hypothetical protein EI94DRAFT_1773692 [Lactarius quietus]|nr:hypothetical protein EI94DRAFT_1773692 [Lactarius quietus]
MAMAEGKVNRLDTLLQTGLNCGLGVRGLMVLLDCARKGLYKPKSFTEEEMSHGLLFLRLGGAHVASLAHQTLGTPTLSTLHYGSLAKSTITLLLPSAGSGCGYILMINEIKVEERMQWDPSTNRILGLCQEHTEHVGLDFCSMSDAAALVQGILCGEIHHASEAMVFSIGVLLDRTCKWEGCARHAQLISTISTIGCPLFSIASDGECCRGSALTMLMHHRPLDPGSELLTLLGKLWLMNMLDYKHIMKPCRNFTIHKSGIMVNGFAVTPTLLHFHLQANKEIWSLPPPALTDKPGFVAARGVLLMLGSLFRHLVLPFVQVSLSLHDQLVHLSAATHLLIKAMPLLTFKDIILLVKNVYFCTAKAKIYTPNGNLYHILNGTDRLESTFGIVQMMVGNDANADILTLGFCLLHAVECLNILSEHPTWDRGPRRLHLHRIEDGNGDVWAKCDHITPESWEGCINVRNISLVTSWNLGSIDIEGALQELESKGYNMEFPFSQVAESPEESDNNNKGNSTPVVPDTLSLSVQDVMTLITSLKLDEGECHILFLGQVTCSD